MLILKNFHDYYDTASAYGIDKTYVYKRIPQIFKGDFEMPSKSRYGNSHWYYEEEFEYIKRGVKYKYIISKVIVGFCGKLYPCVVVDKETSKKERFTFYDTEKLLTFVAKEKIKFETRRSYWSIREVTIRDDKSLKMFFEGSDYKQLEENFIKYQTPVFVYGRIMDEKLATKERILINPKLKDYRFFQVKDPQTAFQDIFMYISGVLGLSAPQTVEISDKEMAIKKGHDGKYSFRKPPGKRGNPKWR